MRRQQALVLSIDQIDFCFRGRSGAPTPAVGASVVVANLGLGPATGKTVKSAWTYA
jgi:hypothetical protein